jgi:glycosidase
MDRFLFIAGGDKEVLRRAATAQLRLPGPPVIYYGTEVGLEQKVSKTPALGLDVCRVPMQWDGGQDRALFGFYQELIRERKARR